MREWVFLIDILLGAIGWFIIIVTVRYVIHKIKKQNNFKAKIKNIIIASIILGGIGWSYNRTYNHNDNELADNKFKSLNHNIVSENIAEYKNISISAHKEEAEADSYEKISKTASSVIPKLNNISNTLIEFNGKLSSILELKVSESKRKEILLLSSTIKMWSDLIIIDIKYQKACEIIVNEKDPNIYLSNTIGPIEKELAAKQVEIQKFSKNMMDKTTK